MPETINWSFSVDAVNGPRVSGSDAFEVDAYDKVSVVLTAAGADVQVQPGTGAVKVHLLVIRASAYDARIMFSADGGTPTIPLDGPVVLIGSGAVSLLDGAPPDGAPPDGAPPDGAPPDGAPPDGAPPDGAPPDDAPPDDAPPDSAPQTLKFANGTGADVTIDILVGRDSAPESTP